MKAVPAIIAFWAVVIVALTNVGVVLGMLVSPVWLVLTAPFLASVFTLLGYLAYMSAATFLEDRS